MISILRLKKKNNRFDKEQAENIGALLYYYTANKNYDSILNLMGNSFYKMASKEDLKELLTGKEKKIWRLQGLQFEALGNK